MAAGTEHQFLNPVSRLTELQFDLKQAPSSFSGKDQALIRTQSCFHPFFWQAKRDDKALGKRSDGEGR